jgi:NitT/TauT family transport system permease protein
MTTLRRISLRERLIDAVVLVFVLLFGWQLAYLWAGDVAMTTPWETIRFATETLFSAAFWPHVWATISAFLIAMAIAATGGILIGALLGYNRLAGEVAEPVLVGI